MRLLVTMAVALSLLTVRAAVCQGTDVPAPPPGAPTNPPISHTDLLAASIAAPPPPPVPWVRGQMHVAACVAAPKVDGLLGDACWREATHVAGFYRLTGAMPVSEQTEAWVCADARRLYVAFHCLDSRPELIKAGETQRGGNVFNDDTVTLDIDSQTSRRNLSVFVVTARGTQWERLEGGTADNITWAGDWTAATQRTSDGWTAEIAIPFALLRYPRNARSFAMMMERKLARETSSEVWPGLPPGGDQNQVQYLSDFTGLTLPAYAPRPVFLPYALATAGAGQSARQGLDIKYPLSTTLTGVATLFPDFRTVEQDVTSINFSYTEKFLSDRRPFFAEGRDFFPFRDLFYSRRIESVDEGLKVAGKQGATSIGLLTTDTRGHQAEDALALALSQDLGLYSRVELDLVGDNHVGRPSNRTAKLEGVYGWQTGRDRYSVTLNHAPSWQGGVRRDSKDFAAFRVNGRPGHVGLNVNYDDIGPRFVSDLGFVPEENLRGGLVSLEQFNQFDKGRIEFYDVGMDMSSYQHHTGGFFRNGMSAYAFMADRSGVGFDVGLDRSQRDGFHDRTASTSVSWGGKTLFQNGHIGDTIGRQAGQRYNFLSFSQGILVSRLFSLQTNLSRLRLGTDHSTQAIVTGTYRLNTTQTLGGRLVNQPGGTSVFFSFGQHVRVGSDLFVLLGDPNSPKTRGLLTVKVITPF